MYESNNANAFNGHTNYPLDDGGITKKQGTIRGKSLLDDRADLSDTISNFIGKGYKSFSDEDSKSDFQDMIRTLGKDKATELMKHIFIFNNRVDMKNKNPQEKVQSFYSLGAEQPELNQLLSQIKSVQINYGLNTSVNVGSKRLSGQDTNEAMYSPLQFNMLKRFSPKD